MSNIFNELTLEEKIGQKFIFGTNTNNIDLIEELIKNSFIGGVILYRKNYNSYEEMLNVIKKLKKANQNNKVPLFIAIDEEGGRVYRMPDEIHRLKNIYEVSKNNPLLVNDYARLIGKMLNNMGINMNFAPVLDIYNNSESGALYKRCFYGDEKDISKLGKRYIFEIEKQNVVPVIKHYPGHGSTRFDSHHLVPYVFNYKVVINKHMKPFNDLIDEKIDALMLGHITIRKLTKGLPASISGSFINKYLRKNKNYDGLIITDEINMLKRHPIYRFLYINKVLKSGNDIALVKVKTLKEAKKIINKYKRIYNIDHLNSSVKRILNVKEKYSINDKIEHLGMNINDINYFIDNINNKIEEIK